MVRESQSDSRHAENLRFSSTSTASGERSDPRASDGTRGLTRALAALLAGIAYAVATLLVVDATGGGTVVLALVVGAFMLLASLHAKLDWLFAPAGFLGYASLFGVNAAGATVFGLDGLAGVVVATVLAVVVGAHVGWVVDRVSDRLA